MNPKATTTLGSLGKSYMNKPTRNEFINACTDILRKYENLSVAKDQCLAVSCWLRYAADKAGFANDEVSLMGCYVNGNPHSFIVLQDYVIDFTLSQFYQEEDFPFVIKYSDPIVGELYQDIADEMTDWESEYNHIDPSGSKLAKLLDDLHIETVEVDSIGKTTADAKEAESSILDFPRKKLPSIIWDYPKEGELPILNPEFRKMVLEKADFYTKQANIPFPYAIDVYGGAASYQWSPGADIDLSLYIKWPDNITVKDSTIIQDFFKEVAEPWKGSPVHFFLKSPNEKEPIEVADSYYEIIEDKWVLPPLVLPPHFDPDEYFKPFLETSEKVAQDLDLKIGSLMRDVKYLKKLKDMPENEIRDQDLVDQKMTDLAKSIHSQIGVLADKYDTLRKKRDLLYNTLRKKLQDSGEIGRMARYQEPEIVWKYLDRGGYLDLLYGLKKSVK